MRPGLLVCSGFGGLRSIAIAQIDAAVGAERGDQLAGLRVDGGEAAAAQEDEAGDPFRSALSQ